MKTKAIFIICLFILLFLISSQRYLIPADVLNNLPSFSEKAWERPANSLQADPVYQFEPWRNFAKNELLSLRFPLWNDLNGSGAPLFANLQSAVLYPTNFIYYLFAPKLALLIIPLLKLFLFFSFTYLYLRSIKINSYISFMGATALSFSGFMILWLNWPHTNVYLIFPFLLFITEKIKNDSKNNYRNYIYIAVAYAFAIFGGHPETLLYVFVIHFFYLLLRLRDTRRKLFKALFSIFLGFMLAAVQLIPFIEYLSYSYALHSRTSALHSFYLPIESFVYNLYPFILGAPHLSFYRSISPLTNFQEGSGGYVGLAIILFVLIGVIFTQKKDLNKFWIFIIFISWFLSFRIWPVNFLEKIPFFGISAHQRIIAFAGFGIVVLFCLIFQEIILKKIKFQDKFYFSNKMFLLLSLIPIILSVVFANFIDSNFEKYKPFIQEYLIYFNIISYSTILFFWSFVLYLKKKLDLKILYLLTFFVIICQSVLLFWNYNPLIKSEKYYPEIKIVESLRKMPRGNILEVGNPSLPANVNLHYEIPSSVNNDAVEILWYKSSFNKDFEKINNWSNPEFVSEKSLKKLNINYVISDFDINLEKNILQGKSSEVLNPLKSNNKYKFEFTSRSGQVNQIRLKTATFNRENNCLLIIKINNLSNDELLNKKIDCKDLRNNVFITLPVDFKIDENQKYTLEVSSNSTNINNAIALYGFKDKPYFEILYANDDKKYELVDKTISSYIYKIENKEIESPNKYKIIYQDPQKFVFETKTNGEIILVKKTFFPGWQAYVNGQKTKIINSNPFMLIKTEKGMNYVELFYKPISFTVGLFLSVFTALFLFIYILRKEYQSGNWISVKSKLIILKNNSEYIEFWEHVMVIGLGTVIGILSYLILILNFHPNFSVPYTTTISWFVNNNYPRQQEYFYLFTAFAYVLIVSIVVWLLFVWKRKK